MSLIRWADKMFPVFTSEVEDFFSDDFFKSPLQMRSPAVNVSETSLGYHLELAVPGLKKEDFNLEVQKDMIIVSARKESSTEEAEKSYLRKEYSYSRFRRSFMLPKNALPEKISAEYFDGILQIEIPKAETEEAEPIKRIEIS